jgi:hypothetical protein
MEEGFEYRTSQEGLKVDHLGLAGFERKLDDVAREDSCLDHVELSGGSCRCVASHAATASS